jgi:hypothetical protein
LGDEQRRLEPQQPHVPEHGGQAIFVEQGLVLAQLELHHPADPDIDAWQFLREAREAHRAPGRLGAKGFHLLVEPALELLGGDEHAGVTADGDLNHGQTVRGEQVRGNGSRCASCPPLDPHAECGQPPRTGRAATRPGTDRDYVTAAKLHRRP